MDLCTDLQFQIIQYLDQKKILFILKKTIFPFEKYSKGIQFVISNPTNLKYYKNVNAITLSSINRYSDARYLNKIKNVSIINCSRFIDNSLSYLKTAHFVLLKDCTLVTDDGMVFLSKVKKLHFDNLDITNRCFNNFNNNLEDLHVVNCKNITIDCFDAKCFKNIRKLNFTVNSSLTPDNSTENKIINSRQVDRRLKKLEKIEDLWLNFSNLIYVSKEGLSHLKNSRIVISGSENNNFKELEKEFAGLNITFTKN